MASNARKTPKKPVKDVEVIEIIHGTASKVSIKLTFQNDTDDSVSNVCVKDGFNPDIRESLPFLYVVYRLEAEFYYYLAPKLKIPLPPVLYAGTDTVNGQGIVVMADLKAEGYAFGNLLETWTIDRAKLSVEQLASLHVSNWGGTGEAISIKDAILGLLAPDEWDKRFAPDARPPIPEYLENREAMTAKFKALWESDSKMKCIVHRDAHIGSTLMSPGGEEESLAFLTGSALSIQDRRAHEKDLLQSYLSALKHGGGPELEIKDIWGEYRRYLHGLLLDR